MQDTEGTQNRTITTKLVGGLGNQLFCFFAGKYLAERVNARLIVDVSDIRSGRSAHNVTIESLKLDANFVDFESGRIAILEAKLRKRFQQLGLMNATNIYYSNVVGFDPNLDQLTAPIKIDGYFQSYRYFYSQKNNLDCIEIASPTLWYRGIEKIFDSKYVTALHFRRGDYNNLKQEYGLLSSTYYLSCLRKLNEMSIRYPIYIFSDDIEMAKNALGGHLDGNVVWVSPPENSSPAESMMLMSKAKVNIIANSTFSWWGAALNKNDNLVLAPRKWFRNMEDPDQLYPPEWITIESHWED